MSRDMTRVLFAVISMFQAATSYAQSNDAFRCNNQLVTFYIKN